MITTWLVLLLMAGPAFALECGTGCYEYNHTCACEEKTEADTSAKPSDEKPPRSGRTEVTDAAMPPSCAVANACSDQKAIDAAQAGKRAAGIKWESKESK